MRYSFSVKMFTYTDTYIQKNINPRGKAENFCVNIYNLVLPTGFSGGSDDKEGVRRMERLAWKHTLPYVNRQPAGDCCMTPGTQTRAL